MSRIQPASALHSHQGGWLRKAGVGHLRPRPPRRPCRRAASSAWLRHPAGSGGVAAAPLPRASLNLAGRLTLLHKPSARKIACSNATHSQRIWYNELGRCELRRAASMVETSAFAVSNAHTQRRVLASMEPPPRQGQDLASHRGRQGRRPGHRRVCDGYRRRRP
jgi:hypothetical protein